MFKYHKYQNNVKLCCFNMRQHTNTFSAQGKPCIPLIEKTKKQSTDSAAVCTIEIVWWAQLKVQSVPE